MPEISRFFGIVIRMHFDDHHPPHWELASTRQQLRRIEPLG
jgi:hypothetical protein